MKDGGEQERMPIGNEDLQPLISLFRDARGRDAVVNLYELEPESAIRFADDVKHFKQEGVDLTDSLPGLVDYLQKLNIVLTRERLAKTLDETTLVRNLVRDLRNQITSENLGRFASSAVEQFVELDFRVRRKRILIDEKGYRAQFHTSLPQEIFDFFDSDRTFGKAIPGLSSSLQGNLAASERLSKPIFRDALHGELNLCYPGSGAHLGPLVIAFDLIERGSINQANFLLVDIRDANEGIKKILGSLESAGAITHLKTTLSTNEANQKLYKLRYKNREVKLYFRQQDLYELNNWDPGGKIVNVIYDHLPFNSAKPGSASWILAQGEGLLGRRVVHVMPTSTLDIDSTFDNGKIVSVERINNVAFADKHTWNVKGDKGVGLTMALVDYKTTEQQ